MRMADYRVGELRDMPVVFHSHDYVDDMGIIRTACELEIVHGTLSYRFPVHPPIKVKDYTREDDIRDQTVEVTLEDAKEIYREFLEARAYDAIMSSIAQKRT